MTSGFLCLRSAGFGTDCHVHAHKAGLKAKRPPQQKSFCCVPLWSFLNLMEIFDYDNNQPLPRKCRVESRSECDASVELGGRSFRIPVVPANMKTVVDEKICTWMAQNGYFYVMHRFDLDNLQFVKATCTPKAATRRS
ncbi:MAG: hypothetical protein U5K75_02925 [Ahrensia sp.]|nr:hypothetical protein [Ahrensia sp.]